MVADQKTLMNYLAKRKKKEGTILWRASLISKEIILIKQMTSIFNSAQYKNQRVAVLIDVQNLYHSARALFQNELISKSL